MWTDPASAEPGPIQGIEWVPWAIVCNYDARDLSSAGPPVTSSPAKASTPPESIPMLPWAVHCCCGQLPPSPERRVEDPEAVVAQRREASPLPCWFPVETRASTEAISSRANQFSSSERRLLRRCDILFVT